MLKHSMPAKPLMRVKPLLPKVAAGRARGAAFLVLIAGGALLLAACGGSPSNDASVAHLGTTTTTKAAGTPTTSSTGSSSGSPGGGGATAAGPGPGGGPGQGMAMADPGASQSQLLAFSHCMQTHGVPNFPEPNAQGVFSLNGISQNTPGFQAANSHCRKLLPNGGQPTAAQKAKMVAQALKFSECMRSHGIADFPDPDVKNGGAQISITVGGKGSDLNPNNPQFQAAQSACQGILPMKGKTSTNGGPK